MEHRYRYRPGLHLHPLPEVQPDVRTHRHTSTCGSPMASEHGFRINRRIPVQDSSEVIRLISSMPHTHMNRLRKRSA